MRCAGPVRRRQARDVKGRPEMDGQQFDRLVQGAATGITRRMALGALVAGGSGLVRGQVQEGAASRRRDQRVTQEGPCGDGGIRANRCKHHGQCCTGFCNRKKGKQPYGRCRCKKAGQGCRENRNCCATAGQPMTCQDRVCTSAGPTPPPPACGANEADCPVNLANAANGGCCLQDVACCNGDEDCSDGQTCVNGCCQSVCRAIGGRGDAAAC